MTHDHIPSWLGVCFTCGERVRQYRAMVIEEESGERVYSPMVEIVGEGDGAAVRPVIPFKPIKGEDT